MYTVQLALFVFMFLFFLNRVCVWFHPIAERQMEKNYCVLRERVRCGSLTMCSVCMCGFVYTDRMRRS